MKLPRRYVSRQRLCLRGISSYWVNDAIGQPFFVVERQIDDGLLQTLRRDIIPRLLREVPGQPSDEQLEQDRLLCRFVIVFDREGYSPAVLFQIKPHTFLKEISRQVHVSIALYRPWMISLRTKSSSVDMARSAWLNLRRTLSRKVLLSFRSVWRRSRSMRALRSAFFELRNA